MNTPNLTEQAFQALKAGDRANAQRLFTQTLAQGPKDERAWLGLAACLDDPERRRYCLQRALELRPGNLQAQQALDELERRQPPVEDARSPDDSGASENISPLPVIPDDISRLDWQSDQPATPKGASYQNSEPPSETDRPVEPENGGQLEPDHSLNDIRPSPSAGAVVGKAANRKPPPKQRGFSTGQSCIMAFLVLLALASIIALVIVLFWSSTAAPGPFGFIENQAGGQATLPENALTPATLAIVLAPTWTPTLSPTPAAATQPPTPVFTTIPTDSPAPVASITPLGASRRLVIGHSAENRPIEVVRFGTGRKERMIVAGIHGGAEQNTIDLAGQLIDYLESHADLVPEGYTLYILRSLNPDGAAKGNVPEARFNAHGVDLNRNFDTNWKATWRTTGCQALPGTAGSAPGSELETKALENFLLTRRVEALIDYHSAGLGVFPSGSPAHPDSVRLAQAIAALGDYAYPPKDTGCEYTGTLVDWAVDHGIPAAVDLELNTPDQTEFEQNLDVLKLLLSFNVERAEPTITPMITITGAPIITTTQTTTSTLQSPTATFTITPNP